MGQVGFTPLQQTVFDAFSRHPLAKSFYFTGGTALSVCYLHHRESDDLDFFSEQEFSDAQILQFIEETARTNNLTYRFTQQDETRIFEFEQGSGVVLKVDFALYPYPRVEKGKQYQGIVVDSMKDIAGNKLLCITQRTQVKDFVDLYFLLQTYSLWDLFYILEAKFRMKMDLVLVASDFLKVEEFDVLPKMILPLSLTELQQFFRQQALQLGKKITQ